MAFKAIVFLLASFLLVTIRASTNEEELFMEAAYAKVPVKAPAPAPVEPPAKAPVMPPAKAPVKPPSPPLTPTLPPVSVTECPRLCGERCKKHSRLRQCKRVCVTCCTRCKCVPPGTYGNREMCGKCYTDMTTHGNRPKCP